MHNTKFVNCTGLPSDSEQYSTAKDVNIMTRKLMSHEKYFDYRQSIASRLRAHSHRENYQHRQNNQQTQKYNFINMMNEKAQEWGMHNTKFVNCTGLPSDSEQYS